jgi:hypothetical protein
LPRVGLLEPTERRGRESYSQSTKIDDKPIHGIEFSVQRYGPICAPLCDGGGRNRTGDTTVFSRVLYRLSYPADVFAV